MGGGPTITPENMTPENKQNVISKGINRGGKTVGKALDKAGDAMVNIIRQIPTFEPAEVGFSEDQKTKLMEELKLSVKQYEVLERRVARKIDRELKTYTVSEEKKNKKKNNNISRLQGTVRDEYYRHNFYKTELNFDWEYILVDKEGRAVVDPNTGKLLITYNLKMEELTPILRKELEAKLTKEGIIQLSKDLEDYISRRRRDKGEAPRNFYEVEFLREKLGYKPISAAVEKKEQKKVFLTDPRTGIPINQYNMPTAEKNKLFRQELIVKTMKGKPAS